MVRPLKIAWKHTAEELFKLFRREKDTETARRWQALWLLRQGERLIRVKAVVEATKKLIQRWVQWYETGGLGEVARQNVATGRRIGEHGQPKQRRNLMERHRKVGFSGGGTGRRWLGDWRRERMSKRNRSRKKEAMRGLTEGRGEGRGAGICGGEAGG